MSSSECLSVPYVLTIFFIVMLLFAPALTYLVKRAVPASLKTYGGQNSTGKEITRLTMKGTIAHLVVLSVVFGLMVGFRVGADSFN